MRKGPDECRKDQSAVAAALESVALAATHADADSAHVAASEKHAAVCAERQELTRAMNAKVSLATVELQDAMETMNRANAARGELQRLRDSNPLLHTAVTDPATPPKNASPVNHSAPTGKNHGR